MKNSLLKYKILSASAIVALNTNAKIIYTDVDPDLTFSDAGDEFLLDFNDDGVIDVKLSTTSNAYSGSYYGFSFNFQSNGVTIDPYNNSLLMKKYYSFSTNYSGGYNTNTTTELAALRANDKVSNNGSFESTEASLRQFTKFNFGPFFDSSGYNGNFKDTTYDKFVGVKFVDGGNDYYGWIRVSTSVTDESQSFTIFDYAYEDSTNSIYAGAGIVSPGSVSINEDISNEFNAYFSETGLKIDLLNSINNNIYVYSPSGKQITSFKDLNVKTKTFDSSIFKENQIYIVTVINEHGKYSKKVVK